MTDLSASDLLATLAAELGRLSDTTEGFHDLVAADGVPSDASFVIGAQAIDLVTQSLAELAEFCANLSADTPADTRLPAAQALSLLRLAELRDRLTRGSRAASERQAGEGAFELF